MKRKVVIFGAWQEGISLFFEVCQKVDIVAFIDNNPDLQSKEIYGIPILSPQDLGEIIYDEIFISSSKRYYQMRVELLKLGVDTEKIKIVFGTNKIRRNLADFNDNILNNYYEKKWTDLKKIYEYISLYSLDVSSIGEMTIRLWKIIEDEQKINKKELRVFIPTIGSKRRVCNQELINLLEGKLNVVNKDFEFWLYVLNIHGDEIKIFDYNKYIYRTEITSRIIQKDYTYVSFRDSQIEYGRKRLKEMGIVGDYVCLLARSSGYAESTLRDSTQRRFNMEIHEYRNSNFYNYESTIDYLKTIDLQAVRMGRGEQPIKNIDNCIDYAGLYADDFMDIFLMANCEFAIIGGGSGIFTLATSFGRPVLFVNLVPVSFGNGGEVYTEIDTYIPKKLFCKSKNRYLSLREMALFERDYLTDGRKYSENNIVFMENTPEEILKATKELLARMNNQWVDTEDRIFLYQKYLSIMSCINDDSEKNIYNWVGGAMQRRLSMEYLSENLYLLD